MTVAIENRRPFGAGTWPNDASGLVVSYVSEGAVPPKTGGS